MVVNAVTTIRMKQSKELAVIANNVEAPLQITRKDPKKVAPGKRLAE